MSTFYTDLAALAQELLEEFGTPLVLTRTVAGGYDPETGSTTGDTVSTYQGVGAKFDYAQTNIDGTQIKQGDQRVYMGAVGMTTPQTGDKLTTGGKVFEVIAARTLAPSETQVLFDVQVRGVQ